MITGVKVPNRHSGAGRRCDATKQRATTGRGKRKSFMTPRTLCRPAGEGVKGKWTLTDQRWATSRREGVSQNDTLESAKISQCKSFSFLTHSKDKFS